MMSARKNHAGFSLLELIIAISIVAVMAGLFLPQMTRLYRSSVERSYMTEAKNVSEAVELYLLDAEGKDEPIDLVYEMMKYGLDDKRNVLRPYLRGRFREGAFIRWINLDKETGALLEIEYCVSGYVIDVKHNSGANIMGRPGAD